MAHRQSRKKKKEEAIRHRDAFSLLQKGKNLFRGHHFYEAEDVFLKVLSIEPQNPRALLGLADIYGHTGRFNKWAEKLEEHLSLSPPTEYTLYSLGNAYRALNRPRQATRSYERVLELNPSNIKAMTRLGDLYLKNKDFQKASGYYRKALDLESHNIYALRGLANTCRGQKKYGEALAVFEEILAIHPDDYRTLSRMGDIHLKLGQVREAQRRYREALKYYPNYGYALEGLKKTGSF